MSGGILACRTDLPFYLRLPSSGIFTWDPNKGTAAIVPLQRLGDTQFLKPTQFANVHRLLDSPSAETEGPAEYTHVMTCETVEYDEIPTLEVAISPRGGFRELRAYSEVTVFLVTDNYERGMSEEDKRRAIFVLNHFLDLYRLVTQDPYVHRVDDELHLYFIDYSLGAIPAQYRTDSARTILSHLDEVHFPRDIGPNRNVKIRLNTLEDLFPGKVLSGEHLRSLVDLAPQRYETPLHYELILNAQSAMKQRRYHLTILDAETAFEVYVATRLVGVSLAIGRARNEVLLEMENPRQLGLLAQRLRALDEGIRAYRRHQGLPEISDFVNSAIHVQWKRELYELRHRVVHEGWRFPAFEQAKQAIAIAKIVIKELESRVPGLADRVQIYEGVAHLVKTAGRLAF